MPRLPWQPKPPAPAAAAPVPFAAWLHIAVPVVGVGLYLASEGPCAKLRDALKLPRDGAAIKAFVFAHNVALAAYSAWTAYLAWPLAYGRWAQGGFRGVHCDLDFWTDTDFGWLVTLFYVSKYYEFVDSWILVFKHKKPSFLQKYHHAGIVLTMYWGVVTKSNWLVWPTTLNSSIHAVMYSYYAAATLGYRSPYAKILTMAQMTQFVVGVSMSTMAYFFRDCASTTPASLVGLACIELYAVGLLYLFNEMAKAKYAPAGKGKRKKAAILPGTVRTYPPPVASPKVASPRRTSPRLARRG